MTTELKITDSLPVPLNQDDMFTMLSRSLYPGAQRESVKLVLDYCKATKLDPMLKVVHIVPMYCATGKKDSKGYDIKEMRDTIMPGIGLYRIMASRTGEYAGVSEPEFGDDQTETLDGKLVTYPKFCKITVKRHLKSGSTAEFTSFEYWKENYATKGKTLEPNAMWLKRPYGQISKCAEAQALRKAFPEIGSQPTADEMEGKEIDVTPPKQEHLEEKPVEYCSVEKFNKNMTAWKNLINEDVYSTKELLVKIATKTILTEEQVKTIKSWGKNEDN